ncbi:MAG: FAD binding domain-containing protein [Gemmatimonadales bacterium]
MIPAAFDYRRPGTLEEAFGLLAEHGEGAKLLAGGHSLLPAMKTRLAQPGVLLDLGRIAELRGIRDEGGRVAIGAMTTHHEIESSDLLRRTCPLLPEVAGCIGDVQVRNRGTIGGSLAHADPAADWPAAMLALEAEVELVARAGRRTVTAADFFLDLFQTALQPGEILAIIRVPATAKSIAYRKFAQKASGFALCGVAAVIGPNTVRVGITGVAAKPYRARAVESALRGRRSSAAIARAAEGAAEGVEPLSDLHASAEYRAHLARVLTRRALEQAVSRG